MSNASVMDINSTLDTFSFYICAEETYIGIVGFYVAVSLCFFLGTPAHSWLLWLYLRDGWKIKPTQVFLINMTILDLIFSVICVSEIFSLLIFVSITFHKVMYVFFGLSYVSRPLMQVCICVEQYLAVMHPVAFLKYKALEYRIVFTTVVLLMAAACAVSEVFMGTFVNHIFNSVFFISVIIILFCCVSVLHVLKHPGPGDTQISVERGRDVGNQQKRKAFNIIFSGLLIILITYLPQVSITILATIKINEKTLFCDIVPFMSVFNVLSVMINPLIKMYKNRHAKCLHHQTREN